MFGDSVKGSIRKQANTTIWQKSIRFIVSAIQLMVAYVLCLSATLHREGNVHGQTDEITESHCVKQDLKTWLP